MSDETTARCRLGGVGRLCRDWMNSGSCVDSFCCISSIDDELSIITRMSTLFPKGPVTVVPALPPADPPSRPPDAPPRPAEPAPPVPEEVSVWLPPQPATPTIAAKMPSNRLHAPNPDL